MCFTIDPDVLAQRQTILDAMHHIENTTGFTFLECREAYCDDDNRLACDDYVDFTPTAAQSCYSFVGRVGGRQAIGISPACSFGNIVHVLLHAMGLHHLTDRPDRDAHVQIAWECVDRQKRSFFAIEHHHVEAMDGKDVSDQARVNVPYDYYSILHFRADAFVNESRPSCMTVIPRIQDAMYRQEVINTMGHRDRMSLMDIYYVWELYPTLKTQRRQSDRDSSLAHRLRTQEDEAASTTNTNDHMHEKDDQNTELPIDYHESRLHTKADALDHHLATALSTSNKVGAFVCVIGFVALMVFVAFELVRISKRKEAQIGHESDSKFEDPLLADPIYD
jgi:hypothetical protein